MSDQNYVENADNIINRLASDLERLKPEIDKLLGQIYGNAGTVMSNGKIKKRRMTPPVSGLKYPEVRNLIVELRGQACSIKQIVNAIKNKWPKNPEKYVSKSSIHRFIMRAKQGQLHYYDFDISIQNQKR